MKKQSIKINVAVNCIIENNGKFLLVKQARPEKVKGKWGLPGGKVEKGESFSEAIIRETQEEIGLSITKYKYIGCKQKFPQETLKHFFAVISYDGEVNFAPNELLDAKWFALSEIKKIKDELRKDWVLEVILEYSKNKHIINAPNLIKK